MSHLNVLPPLAEEPRDARDAAAMRSAGRADEVIYRLGLRCLPVPGLPAQTNVDDIAVAFVRGPLRAQHTEIRQRHGVPFIFDKRMTRTELGENEMIAVFTLREAPVPPELERAFERWRARALAAAGLITAVLDERVAADELFEDALLLRRGAFVGAADMRGVVRTYMPFEVNAADRHAIDQLRSVSLSEVSDVARAARLYRRAALEGPIADAYAMLWVAAEAFSEHSSPSRKEIEAALVEGGLDPESLPLHVGLLIDLRGRVQHHGLEIDERIRTAFYEMEAVVRALIRHHAQLRGGWWPAANDPAAFAEPFDHALAALQGPGGTEWHGDRLPPVAEPRRLSIPRRIAKATTDPRLDVDPALGDALELVANIVIDAVEWQAPDATIAVQIGRPEGVPKEATQGASAERIWLSEENLRGFDDPEDPKVLVNLVWDLHALVGAAIAQQSGLVSEGPGVATVQAVGAYAQYRRLIAHGEFDAELLQIPAEEDAVSLGKIAGWAAAGDGRAQRRLDSLTGHKRELAEAITDGLTEEALGPPEHVLELGRAAARDVGLSPDW
jgi:hypothetical protein